MDLEGAVIAPDEDAMREVYGQVIPANQVLTGKVKVPATAQPFIAAVTQANMQAKASK